MSEIKPLKLAPKAKYPRREKSDEKELEKAQKSEEKKVVS